MGYNYAIYKASEPKGGAVRTLVDWLLTDEGQSAVTSSGYVAFNGKTGAELSVNLYRQTGTGKATPQPGARVFEYSVNAIDIRDESAYIKIGKDTFNYVKVMGLKDNTLLDKINSDIKSEVIRLVGDGSACAKLLNKEYKDISDSFRVEFACKNGYLSVFMSLSDSKGANRTYASVMYDLISGEKLEFPDMLAPGSNFY